MAVTKAVILARGLGTRMRANDESTNLSGEQAAAASAGTKGLINVGRPFLDYVISAFADAGIKEVCLVIGPEHDAFRNYYDNVEKNRVTITYAIQEEPLGTANAVAAAADFIGEDRSLVLNSDNYYPVPVLKQLVQAPGLAVAGFSRAELIANSNIEAERVKSYAIMDVGDGVLQNIIEKPSDVEMAAHPDAPVNMNCWLFDQSIITACESIEPSVRGEYELTDAVRYLIRNGSNIEVVPVACGVLDMSSRRDIGAIKDALQDVEVSL